MAEVKTSRPYRERFLDGYDRHELREEVQKVKPSKRFGGLRKKTASWALGASLALGGIGIPLKLGLSDHAKSSAEQPGPPPEGQQPPAEQPIVQQPPPTDSGIKQDLTTAQNIARQVTGGVSGAVQDVAHVATAAPIAVAQAPVEVAKAVTNVAEAVKEHFFNTQVPFGKIIYDEARKNALPPELVAAVVRAESKFMPTARSNAGAVGLMQLVPRTGRWLGARDLTNPAQNVMAGAKYLRYLTDRFNGDTQKAVAAYNAGEGNVRRFGGVPPFRETRDYVSRVSDYRAELGQRIAGHDIAMP
jgi:hypothetical protein